MKLQFGQARLKVLTPYAGTTQIRLPGFKLARPIAPMTEEQREVTDAFLSHFQSDKNRLAVYEMEDEVQISLVHKGLRDSRREEANAVRVEAEVPIVTGGTTRFVRMKPHEYSFSSPKALQGERGQEIMEEMLQVATTFSNMVHAAKECPRK
jgi:hypothetical protein